MRAPNDKETNVTPRLGWSAKEAAVRVGCSYGLIRKLIDEGKLPVRRLNRRVIILEADLKALLGVKE